MNTQRIPSKRRTLVFLVVAMTLAGVSVEAAIRLNGFSPNSGPVGTVVTLSGEGFSPVASNNVVMMNGVRAAVTTATETSLTATVPSGAIYGAITVTANGLSAHSRLPFGVTFSTRTLSPSSFDAPLIFNPGHGPGATRLADLDGDGRPDLAVAHQSAVAVYRNIGTGGVAGVFSPKIEFPIGEAPFDLHFADLNGDAHLDMIVVNYNENSVSVFRNTSTAGQIEFAAPSHFPVSAGPHNAAVADLDGDGRLDIVTTGYDQGNIAVLRNTSDANEITFAPHVDFPTMPGAHGVGIQDLDGDGKPDVVVAHHTQDSPAVVVLRNVSEPGAIDSHSLQVVAQLPANGAYVVFADFDADGRPDVVTCSWYSKSVTVFQNLSTPGSLSAASFGPPVSLPSAGSTKRVAVADLDGDGRVDLAFPTELGDSVGIYRNVGGTNGIDPSWFAPRVDLASGWNGDGISIGDIDLDGLPDIVFCSFYIDEVWIYRGIRLTAPAIVTQPTPVMVALGDPAALSVGATGGGLQFRWHHDGELVPDATGPALTISNVRTADAGSYFVVVENSGGRATSEVAIVTVVVARTLALGAAADVSEGGLVSVPLILTSDGEVGGIGFIIHYDADLLAAPEIVWNDSLGHALRESNVQNPGQLFGVLALPATTIPAGTQTLATIQFRARTIVQTNTVVLLEPQILDVSDASGNTITAGSDVAGVTFTIHDTGFLAGDNNANQHLDVGDAALLMRLIAQLDPLRHWDVPGNDLNANQRLDSGDVIKLLRIIAGIDAPPQLSPPFVGPVFFGAASVESLSAVEFASFSPARLQGGPGQLVTLQLRLDSLRTLISGASFTLNYPAAALRLRNAQAHRVGSSVPSGVVPVWNVAPGQNNYATQDGRLTLALSGSTAWSANNAVLAEFTFEVQSVATNRHLWPFTIDALEITGNGFNNRTLDPITASFVGRSPVNGLLTRLSVNPGGDVTFSFSGDAGANYRVDFSDDLVHWLPLREILGGSEPGPITDPGAGSRPQRFYRSVPLP